MAYSPKPSSRFQYASRNFATGHFIHAQSGYSRGACSRRSYDRANFGRPLLILTGTPMSGVNFL